MKSRGRRVDPWAGGWWLAVGFACGAIQAAETNEAGHAVHHADPMVVTARGRETQVWQTPGGVGVINGEAFREHWAVSLSDLGAQAPGVHRTGDGAWGADLNIRGLNRDSVVFLIDGIRVNTATDIGARLGLLDPLDVARVEVLKGPISSLHGSGSIGGVVNVVTRSGVFSDAPAFRAGAAATWRSNPQGFGGYAFGSSDGPDSYVFASQSHRDFESYESGGGIEVHNSQFQDSGTAVRAGHRVSDSWEARINAQYVSGRDIGVPGSGTAPLPAAADVTYSYIERSLFSQGNTIAIRGGTWKESDLNIYGQHINRQVQIDAFPAASPTRSINPEGDHWTLGGKWLNRLERADHTVAVGLDVWERRMETSRRREMADGRTVRDEPLPKSAFLSAGLFAEDDWRLGEGVVANAGGRLDRIHVENESTAHWAEDSRDEDSWNLHAGATWELAPGLRTKAVCASGYRAASLEERFQYLELGGGRAKYGNPELSPERSLFAEWGVIQRSGDVEVGGSVFFNSLEDLIGEENIDAATIRNANVERAAIYGAEAEWRWLVGRDWSLYGNLAHAAGRDTRAHKDLANIPPLSGLVGAAYENDAGYRAHLEAPFAGRQDRTPEGVNAAPGWAVLNISLGRRFELARVEHEVRLCCDNVLDTTYRDYLSTFRGVEFNEPGRAFSVTYRMGF